MTAARQKPPEKLSEKTALFSRISGQVAHNARAAVYYTPGLTLDALVEMALEQAVKVLEKSRGQPFPKKSVKLRAGRPVKL